MELKLDTTDFDAAHYPDPTRHTMDPIPGRNPEGVVDRWVSTVMAVIHKEMMTYPEILNDTNLFTLFTAPYTILDPAAIPGYPDPFISVEVSDLNTKYIETHYGVGAEEIKMYGDCCNPDNEPVTVAGWWNDGYGSGGLFGWLKSDPTVLTVFFC